MGQAVLFFRGLLLDRVASIDRGALFFSFVSRVGTPSCRGPSLRSHAGGDILMEVEGVVVEVMVVVMAMMVVFGSEFVWWERGWWR